MKRSLVGMALALPMLLTACSDPPGTNDPGTTEHALTQRLDEIAAAVADWRDASTIEEAHAAAEAARNLVVGPDGPGYGDADADGTVGGTAERGLLPGLTDEPGIAEDGPLSACVEADVLGGAWDDRATRWATAQAVYDAWTPTNNTMPSLPSHPQRIVGWATLTLATDSLDEAHEYAGHAQLHVDVSRSAVGSCSS